MDLYEILCNININNSSHCLSIAFFLGFLAWLLLA